MSLHGFISKIKKMDLDNKPKCLLHVPLKKQARLTTMPLTINIVKKDHQLTVLCKQ